MKKFFAATAEKLRVAGALLRAGFGMVFNDAIGIIGSCFIIKGVSMIYVPAGWILGGIIMIASIFIRELTRKPDKGEK